MLPPAQRPRIGATATCLFTTLATALSAQDQPPKQPLRLNDLIDPPSQLRFSGQHRTRYESLNGQFRANSALRDNEDQIANRSLLRVDFASRGFKATVEGIDARSFGTKSDSFANPTTVDTIDLLQATAGYSFGGGHEVTVGRYTMDLGSRRLIARNEYRNTINSFVGVRWDYVDEERGYEAGAFWNMPTIPRPADRASLVDNEHDWNKQSTDIQFFGAHAQKRLDEGSTAQVYALGFVTDTDPLDEELWTVGGRYHRPARRASVSAELEAAYQFGDRNGVDVDAHFVHASAGYTFDGATEPSVRVAIDLATGDDSGSDFSRFNTLFGARRFEYGPTGIYGAVGRRNLLSPEIRFSLRPSKETWFMVAWRDVRLETANDQWLEALDNTGQGKHVGHQVECRLRWEPCKNNLRFETGGAYLAGGNFRETSTAGRASDTRYFFFETIFTF